MGQAALWLGYLGAPLWASRRLGAGRLSVDFGFVAEARDALIGLPVGWTLEDRRSGTRLPFLSTIAV